MENSAITGEQPIYHRPKQSMRTLGVGPTKWYELVKAGRIKTLKLGRATLVPTDQYPAFRESLENEAA
jgi:hypothetical protein